MAQKNKNSIQNKEIEGEKREGNGLIDMDEAIRLLKTTRPTFSRWLKAGAIKGMKAGRQWRFTREEIDRFLRGETPQIDIPTDIENLLADLRGKLEEIQVSAKKVNSDRIQEAVSLIIQVGIAYRCNDIHLTCHEGANGTEAHLRFRIDGVLTQFSHFSIRLADLIIKQVKSLCGCNINEKHMPQDGRVHLDVDGESKLDIRASFLSTIAGEDMTMRVLDTNTTLLTLDKLPFEEEDRMRLLRNIQSPYGAIIVTGPTGSGKTTTMYACLMELAREQKKVISIEESVEYILPWVSQIHVNTRQGATLEKTIRSVFRNDPDVVMIGEIRDKDVLEVVCEGALTGHLILSTMHTDSAVSCLIRMLDIGLDPFALADSVRLIISQRLLRVVCSHCSIPDSPLKDTISQAKEMMESNGYNWKALKPKFMKGKGCKKCRMTGYSGRTQVSELLEVSPDICRNLKNNVSEESLKKIAISEGMIPLAVRGVQLAAAGKVNLEETVRLF